MSKLNSWIYSVVNSKCFKVTVIKLDHLLKCPCRNSSCEGSWKAFHCFTVSPRTCEKILQQLIQKEYNTYSTESIHNWRNLHRFSFHVNHHLLDVISSFPQKGPKQTFTTFHKSELKAYRPSQGDWAVSFMAQGFLHTVTEEKKQCRSSREISCGPKDRFLLPGTVIPNTPRLRKVGRNLTALQEPVQTVQGICASLQYRKSQKPQCGALWHLYLNAI